MSSLGGGFLMVGWKGGHAPPNLPPRTEYCARGAENQNFSTYRCNAWRISKYRSELKSIKWEIENPKVKWPGYVEFDNRATINPTHLIVEPLKPELNYDGNFNVERYREDYRAHASSRRKGVGGDRPDARPIGDRVKESLLCPFPYIKAPQSQEIRPELLNSLSLHSLTRLAIFGEIISKGAEMLVRNLRARQGLRHQQIPPDLSKVGGRFQVLACLGQTEIII